MVKSKHVRSTFLIVGFFLFFILTSTGCSGGEGPVSPSINYPEGIYKSTLTEIYEDPGFPGSAFDVAARQVVLRYDPVLLPKLGDLITRSNSRLVGHIPEMHILQLLVKAGIDLNDEIGFLISNPGVISARPNFINDEMIYPEGEPDWDAVENSNKRWHIDSVRAIDAWEYTTGDPSIIVGVIDTGLDFDNFSDFDGRVIHDEVYEPDITDHRGHGTHVAGIACADGNGSGTLGLAWDCMVYPYNSFGKTPGTSTLDMIWAVRRLVNEGADVINMSIGRALQTDRNGDGDFTDEFDLYIDPVDRPRAKASERFDYLPMYEYCSANDVVLVFAAGNNHSDGAFQDDIPVGFYDIYETWNLVHGDMDSFMSVYPSVLIVSAIKKDGFYASFSDRGVVPLVSAPGVDIWSGDSTDKASNPASASYKSGTSMAAPMVAGLAALVRSADTTLTAGETVNHIIYGGRDNKHNKIDVLRTIKDVLGLVDDDGGNDGGNDNPPPDEDPPVDDTPLVIQVTEDPDNPGWVRGVVSAVIDVGEPVTDLTEDNFRLIEDLSERNDFQVQLISGGGEQNTDVDIAFVMDITLSMFLAINGVRDSVISFAETLKSQDLNVRLGGVPYKDDVVGNIFPLSDDINAFQTWVSGLSAGGGGDIPEDGLDAIMAAVEGFEWRPGAQRVIVVITDATVHVKDDGTPFASYTIDQVITELYAGGFVVHTVSSMEDDINPDVMALANATGGLALKLPVFGNVNLNNLPIGDAIAAGYVLRWEDLTVTESEHHLWIGVYRTPEDKTLHKPWRDFEGNAVY